MNAGYTQDIFRGYFFSITAWCGWLLIFCNVVVWVCCCFHFCTFCLSFRLWAESTRGESVQVVVMTGANMFNLSNYVDMPRICRIYISWRLLWHLIWMPLSLSVSLWYLLAIAMPQCNCQFGKYYAAFILEYAFFGYVVT